MNREPSEWLQRDVYFSIVEVDLRNELELKFTRQVLLLEDGILANVGRDHALDLWRVRRMPVRRKERSRTHVPEPTMEGARTW